MFTFHIFMLRPIFIHGSVLGLMATTCLAQTTSLPPTSRTVYRCEVEKKVVYSDEPCLGAKRINVEPTRGLDQSSGKSRLGVDVRDEKNREAFAQALGPLTGMDAKQLQVRGRRNKLSSAAQADCKSLDDRVADSESREKVAGVRELGVVKEELFAMRQRQGKLRC